MDVSRSVVNAEYDLQMGGLAQALQDPDVVDAIGWIPGGVMATMTQWSGPATQTQSVDWYHLTDARSITEFANQIIGAKRAFFVAYTAVGDALWHANTLSDSNPRTCARRVIDVSGDGASNRGRDTSAVASALGANGVTINGLVIAGAKPDPVAYYAEHVIRGPGAFVEVAESFEDYASAMQRKLVRELRPAFARR